MADEIARWAASRAPELIKRAEAEAVAVLRDALLEAAGRHPRTATGESAAGDAPVATTAPEGELIWAYCCMRARDRTPAQLAGVAGRPVERVEAGDLAVLVSRVPAAQFAEAPLRDNLNDLTWLEGVARAHEAVLDEAFMTTTIVPLRLCTLYATDKSLRAMLVREHQGIEAALARLAGRQEWGVKVLIDPERLVSAARDASPELYVHERDLGMRSEGGAYLERRRLERTVRDRADALATDIAQQVHARLQDWTIEAATHPPQNRELSGHEGEMVLNAAYLVDAERAEGLRQLALELEEHHRAVGARIELTGPWPPFNFVYAPGA